MPRSGGPPRPLMGAAMLGLAAWQAAFINAQPGGRSRGAWKPIAPRTAKIAAAASTGAEGYLWVQVKDGGPIKLPSEGIPDVFTFLEAVYAKEEARLKPRGVTVSLLRLYACEEAYKNNATALRPGLRLDRLEGGTDDLNPLFVDYDEPKIGGASVSEASFSEAALQKLTVPNLKAILKVSGKKAELIQRILDDATPTQEAELWTMTVADLRKICRQNGLRPGRRRKGELIRLILGERLIPGEPPVGDAFEEMKRDQLKSLCRAKKLAVSGTRSVLIERLRAAGNQNSQEVFFDKFVEQRCRDIVPLDGPWNELAELLKAPNGLLLRAAPQTGKTTLGQAAEALGRPVIIDNEKWTVKYFCDITDFLAFVKNHSTPREAARFSANKHVIFYVDETQADPLEGEGDQIHDALVTAFFKSPTGRAIFVSPVKNPFGGRVTPVEVVRNTVLYTAPANTTVTVDWLRVRLEKLGMQQHEDVADLLMEVTGGHVGILQDLGCTIQRNSACRNLKTVKDLLRERFTKLVDFGKGARCFGLQNGDPTSEEAEIISMLRCAGKAYSMNASGLEQPGFRSEHPPTRHGFNRAFYAPSLPPNSNDTGHSLVRLEDTEDLGFVHPLQPEMYHAAVSKNKWPGLSFEERWVTDYSQVMEGDGPLQRPQHVVDLVLSWLSHMSSLTLLGVTGGNVDVQEESLDSSLDLFLQELGLRRGDNTDEGEYRKQYPVTSSGDETGKLDFLITGCKGTMGVELLIRSSEENRPRGVTRASVLNAPPTRGYFRGHVVRTSATLACNSGESSYENTAAQCDSGYATILIATTGRAGPEEEFNYFQEFIKQMRREFGSDELGKLRHVLAALAPPGWSHFCVFHYDPEEQDFKRYTIQRQRLMYKRVDGKAVTARHFYPRPTEVWVKELVVEGDELKLTGRAFKVKPEDDDVASLADAIVAKKVSLTCDADELTIYRKNRADGWQKLEKRSEVLYENTEDRPYGFVVPRSAA